MHKDSYHIETLSVGQLATNCYIVSDAKTNDAVIIDPGDDGNYIAEKTVSSHLVPRAILLTHGHFDHVLGAYEVQHIFNIPCYMNEKDNFLLGKMKKSAEFFLHRNIIEQKPAITPVSEKKLVFGTIIIDIISTPGHTPGGLSFLVKKADMICTGDTLFAHGAIGRTDFSYARPLDLAGSLHTLFTLPDTYTIYPGHGECSTIGEEKIAYDNKNNNK